MGDTVMNRTRPATGPCHSPLLHCLNVDRHLNCREINVYGAYV